MLKITLVSCLMVVLVTAQQYKLDFESIEVIKVNPEYAEDVKIVLFKFNETSQAVNGSGTLKKDLDRNIKVTMEASKLQEDGSYRQITNIADINMCDLLDKNQFGLKDLLKYGNFTVCPWKAAFYVTSNVMIDPSKLPPNAPNGKYITNIKYFDGANEILHTRSTGSLTTL